MHKERSVQIIWLLCYLHLYCSVSCSFRLQDPYTHPRFLHSHYFLPYLSMLFSPPLTCDVKSSRRLWQSTFVPRYILTQAIHQVLKIVHVQSSPCDQLAFFRHYRQLHSALAQSLSFLTYHAPITYSLISQLAIDCSTYSTTPVSRAATQNLIFLIVPPPAASLYE